MNAFPAESQQRLLAEHGIDDWFAAYWVDIGDVDEVVRRLQIAAETIARCDGQTAMASYSPFPGGASQVWITSLAPGWSHVLTLTGGLIPSVEDLSAGGHRAFELIHDEDELHPIIYAIDGLNAGELFAYEEYRVYWEDLESDSTMEKFEQWLCIMGRIAGRFLDRGWFASQGLLGELPRSTDPK